ncbi:hypothetical protein AVEN_111745-1 [Araneus ventricosus]|uniref:Uncharacterized protein n=1 Tax=Araneus ventricosus TaxID=182803 RepID=A0A4Y2GN92_ARAVE|nr:hypothetical protein AVEN_111745-1 [Araneus ventricosus]
MSRLPNRRAPSSRHDSIKDPPCMGELVHAKYNVEVQTTSSRYCKETWRGHYQLRCRPCGGLTRVQNYEDRPKTAPVLLRTQGVNIADLSY